MNEPSDRSELPGFSDTPRRPGNSRAAIRRNLMRGGAAGMAGGFLLAALGATLITRGGMQWEGVGSGLHRFALTIMLLSMIVVFLGARLRPD